MNTTKQPFIARTGTDAINRVPYLLLFFMLVLGLGLMSCEGPQGPEGQQGQQGEQGPEGPVGPAGEDGNVIHAGEGAPADDLGEVEDFYLDTAAAEMYGPKTQDGWGVPFTLQGPPGADGEDGEDGQDGADGQDGEDSSQIYAGNGAPDASLGVVGDYYLDKANYELYGPKTTDGWGTPLNLQATTNVMYSVWVDIDWGSGSSDTFKEMLFLEDRITEEFLGNGIILMYLKREGFPTTADIQVFPLPRDWSNGELDFFAQVRTTLGAGRIELFYSSTDGAALPDITYLQVRYVLIPGGEQLKTKAKAGDLSIDLEDYQQVRKYFGIRN